MKYTFHHRARRRNVPSECCHRLRLERAGGRLPSPAPVVIDLIIMNARPGARKEIQFNFRTGGRRIGIQKSHPGLLWLLECSSLCGCGARRSGDDVVDVVADWPLRGSSSTSNKTPPSPTVEEIKETSETRHKLAYHPIDKINASVTSNGCSSIQPRSRNKISSDAQGGTRTGHVSR